MVRNLAFLAMALCAALFAASAAAVAGPKEDCAAKSGDVAIAGCSELIRSNPRDAGAYYNRGVAYRRKGEHDRAVDDYNRAIELNPNLAEAYTSRGIAHGEKGEVDRAVADFNRAIELNPNDAYAYTNRGNAYRRRASTTGPSTITTVVPTYAP